MQLFLCINREEKREGKREMDERASRVAVISIIVEEPEQAQYLNEILHLYSEYIIGRMGIPYREKGISLISIAVDAPQDITNAISGKIGRLPGITSKAVYAGTGSAAK